METITFFTPVQGLIQQVEKKMQAQAEGQHPEIKAALKHLLASGGKRIRPAVALLTGGMLGGNMDRMVTLGAAVEMLHTATLVHDDLIDGALLRRGTPTLNSQWSPPATVLTGDFIFARAARLAAETGSLRMMMMFAETLSTIVNGEITQLFSRRGLSSREDYNQRIYAKTASLFEVATTSAAVLSERNETEVAAVKDFGYGIGMAFQIIDDVLDFTADQSTLGKPVASDLRQGLITLPALLYLESHPDDLNLKAVLNGSRTDEDRLLRLVENIRLSGAIDQAIEEARSYVDRGVAALDIFPPGVEHQALKDLSNYIVRRQL